MPELPEVETMRRGILAAIGSRIESIEQPKSRYRPIAIRPSLRQIKSKLVGRTITDVRRLGKRVVIDVDSDMSLVLQPKMAGLVAIDDVPSKEHIRLIVSLSGGPLQSFIYWDRRGLGTVNLWTAAELKEMLSAAVLGPDALEISFEEFHERFRHLKRDVKPALLDQKLVAGVGNLYASEILHAAKIHPQARCDSLTKPQWRRIFDQMNTILHTAIAYEGSTLSDGTYRNSLNQSGGYQNAHLVYDRAELNCLSCANGSVVRIVQAQRSTFYCPKCQPKR